jgi:dTDP-4-amino-4,6-dideoxygalactose transaminase
MKKSDLPNFDKFIYVTKSDLPNFDKYCEKIRKIWDTHYMTNNGQYVQELEKKLKDFLRVKNFALTTNGTLALMMSIEALNLSGEIITTPFTFIATASSIMWQKCKPIFVDIDPETYNIDSSKIEEYINENTTAIMPVHVFGNPCNIDKVERIAKKHDLKTIYDGAHAFGVKYKNKSIFSYGDVSIFSFHAAKIYHTIEGGGFVTKNKNIYEKMKKIRNFGITGYDTIECVGINSKMNEFQAAMGILNLENLDQNIAKRKGLYDIYVEKFSNLHNIKLQKLNKNCTKYNYSYFTILLDENINRDNVVRDLLKIGVMPRKYFYPMLGNFDFFNNKNELPFAEKISQHILNLPLFSSLRKDIIDKIYGVLEKYEK